jgi:toxin CptA
MHAIAPVRVSLKSSRRLLVIQSAAHFFAAAALFLTSIPVVLQATLMLVVGASLAFQRKPVERLDLLLLGDGEIEKVGADGTAIRCQVDAQSVVFSFLVVLRLQQGNSTNSRTILSDSMSAEDFRALRVWLRWRSTVVKPVELH